MSAPQHLSAEEFRALKQMKPSKYRNKKVVVDGIRFDSQAEARRYATLKLLVRAGQYKELVLQPRYELHAPDGSKVGVYRADFEYVLCSTGEVVTEDVKSPATAATRVFQHKRRHFEAEYGRKLTVTFNG